MTHSMTLTFQNLTMTPEAKIEATMQHEITRLTSENLVGPVGTMTIHPYLLHSLEGTLSTQGPISQAILPL